MLRRSVIISLNRY